MTLNMNNQVQRTIQAKPQVSKMEQGNGGAMVSMQNQNPIEQLQTRFKQLEAGFRAWLTKQSFPVEAAIVTLTNGAQGAAVGVIMGTLNGGISPSLPNPPPQGINPQTMASLMQAQALARGPWAQARNFAVLTGANAGISCVMKRLRGKEDVEGSMAAGFGSVALFSLVSGFGGPIALTSGLFCALVQGRIFKSADKDIYYSKTRSMLRNLGLDHYEENFKEGLLRDYTLPLLNDRALKEVKIPPGARLLILDHIQRDPEFQEKRKHK